MEVNPIYIGDQIAMFGLAPLGHLGLIQIGDLAVFLF